jgi:hypothetical protein
MEESLIPWAEQLNVDRPGPDARYLTAKHGAKLRRAATILAQGSAAAFDRGS